MTTCVDKSDAGADPANPSGTADAKETGISSLIPPQTEKMAGAHIPQQESSAPCMTRFFVKSSESILPSFEYARFSESKWCDVYRSDTFPLKKSNKE